MSGSRLLPIPILLWILAQGLLRPSPAQAESAEAARTRLFREQYERAGRAYSIQDYATAIPALQAAFAIQPAPQILFNIAQAYRRLELYSSARVYFELYRSLEKNPTPELADLTERLIAEMDELEHAKAAPKIRVVEVEKTKLLYVQSEKPVPRWLRPLGAVSGTVGLGLLTTGAAFLGLDGECRSAADPPAVQCAQIYNTGTPGTALAAVGAGVLLLGVITFAVSFKHPPKPTIREEQPALPEKVPARDTLLSPPQLPPADAEPPPAGWSGDGQPSSR